MSDRPTSGGFSRHFINAGVKLSSSANPSTSPPLSGASGAAATNATHNSSIRSKSAYIPPSMMKKGASPPPPHFERQPPPVFHSTSTSTPISNSAPAPQHNSHSNSSVTNSSSPFLYNPSAAAPSFFQHLTSDMHSSHATPPVPRPTVKLPKDSPLLPKGVHTLSNTYHPKPAGVQVLASSNASSRDHSEPSSDGDDGDELHAAERKMLEDVSFFRERRTAAATVESLLRDKREQEKLGEKLAKARAKDMATINSILTPPTAAPFLHSSPPAPVSSTNSNQESPNPSQRASPSPTQQMNYPVSSSSSSSSSALDMSLITSLTQRLSTLEKIASKQAKNLGTKDVVIADLQAQVKSMTHSQDASLLYQLQQELNEAREENAAYKKQVSEMETFLNDYGLVWVGFRAGVSTSNNASTTGATPANPDEHTATASTQANSEGDEKQSADATPSTSITNATDGAATLPPLDIYFDVGQFMASVSELNSIATEGNNLRIHTTSSGVTKFLPQQSLDLILYRDGMWFRNGPLRSWNTTGAKEFVRDVMEGYFPYELKEEFPDGICLAVIDKSKLYCHEPSAAAAGGGGGSGAASNFKAFAGKGNRLDDGKVVDRSPTSSSPTPPAINSAAENNNNNNILRSASPVVAQHPTLSQHAPQPVPLQAFLNKLPEKIVGKNGKLIEVRGEINKVLGQKKASSPSPIAVSTGSSGNLTVNTVPSTSPVSSSPPAASVNPILVDTPALKLLRAREAALLQSSSSVQDGKAESASTSKSLASVASATKAGLPSLPPIATLLIKMDPSDSSPPLLLKLLFNATIREVHDYVLAHRKSNTTQYELRSTYPARHYSNDDQRTIEEAGLTPNCNLFVRNKRPVSGYRQRNLEQKPDESWSVSEPPQ